MSELDRDNAKSIDDEETDDIEEIEDEIEQNVQVAEPTDLFLLACKDDRIGRLQLELAGRNWFSQTKL